MALDGEPGSNYNADGTPRPNAPTRKNEGSSNALMLPPGTVQLNGQTYAPVMAPNRYRPQSLADAQARAGKPIGPIARIVQGIRYMISGTGPEAWMSPNQPLVPLQQQTEGRQFDFPVGYNLTQRNAGEYQSANPWELRALADNHDVTRLAIETRKDQFGGLKFKIQHEDESKDVSDDPDVKKITAQLRFPDNRNPWQQWLRMLVEEVLVTDSATIYPRLTMGGDLWGLDLMDGASIKPLIDATGRRPIPPEPAYQQWLKGIPTSDYTSDELIYLPRNPRVWKVLGFSPVAQIMMTVNIALRRQISQLQYFTEGNIPEVLLSTPSSWTPKQLLEAQTYWDQLMEGVQAFKRKAKMVPGDTKPMVIKESPVKDEFDEWLARVVCYCFSLPPTAFVKQMNRATSETAQDVALQEGLAPLMIWVQDMMDMVLAKYWKRPDLRFIWNDSKAVAPETQAKIDDTNLKNGSTTLDEVRQGRGEDPYPNGLGSRPLIYTSTGIVPLDTAIQQADEPPQPVPAALGGPGPDDPNAPPGATKEPKPAPTGADPATKPGKTETKPGKGEPAKKLVKVAKQRNGLRESAVGKLKAKVAAALKDVGTSAGEQLTKKLKLGAGKFYGLDPYAPTETFLAKFDALAKAVGDDKPAIRVKAPKFVDGVDIPYVAGISKDGCTIYFDRRLPKRMKTKSGWIFDPRDYISVHEIVEWMLIQDGHSYDDDGAEGQDCAHIRATHAEHAAVAAAGGDPAEYEEAMQPIEEACYAAAEAGEMTDIPAGLARYPYGGDAAKLLDKPAEKMAKAAADGGRASKVINGLDLGEFGILTDDILGALRDAADDGGFQALAQVGVQDEKLTELANSRAEAYAEKRSAELIKSGADGGELIEATRDMIRGTVLSAIEDGWSNDRLKQAITESYAFSPKRAEVIARTELQMADSAGAMAGYRVSGVVEKKQWLLSNDTEEVCDICQDNADAGAIDLDEDFPSGDDAPPQHPQCRCFVVPIVAEGSE